MIKPLETAQLYFKLSNESNFSGIKKLFTDTTTYSSQTTGVYLGRDTIIAMQKNFHNKFSSLNWKVISAQEVNPGIILFDYEFTGTIQDGEKIKSSGLEYIIVYEAKIQHIEIRNKTGA